MEVKNIIGVEEYYGGFRKVDKICRKMSDVVDFWLNNFFEEYGFFLDIYGLNDIFYV